MSEQRTGSAFSRVISGEGAEVRRWSLPDVDEGRADAPRTGGGRSVQELEALQQAAYEEAFEQGRKAGHKAGYEAGEREGLKAARAEVEKFNQVMAALADPVARLDDSAEDQLVQLVLQVAQQVIRREIQTQPGEVMAVIREAIAMLPMSAREIAVRLHPDDLALVCENWGDEEHGGWKLVEDPSLSRGGCIVQTPSSRIDATVEKRIAALCTQLLGGERAEDDGDAETDADGEDEQ